MRASQGLELISTTGSYETDENGKELCVWTNTVPDHVFARLARKLFNLILHVRLVHV